MILDTELLLGGVLVGNGSILDALTAVFDEIRQIYYGWQGTWSSVFMFCFEPSIWGEKFYVITPWIGLTFFTWWNMVIYASFYR